jgi:hypothetical protein
MSEYFDGEPYESPFAPLLPEIYKVPARTIESLLPDEIIYVDHSYIVVDTQDQVFIKPHQEYDPVESEAADFADEDYVGIMRFFQEVEEGRRIDGYIIDLRGVSPGVIKTMEVSDEVKASGTVIPVLGIVGIDVNHRVQYSSLLREETIDAAQYLAMAVDERLDEMHAARAAENDDAEEEPEDEEPEVVDETQPVGEES